MWMLQPLARLAAHCGGGAGPVDEVLPLLRGTALEQRGHAFEQQLLEGRVLGEPLAVEETLVSPVDPSRGSELLDEARVGGVELYPAAVFALVLAHPAGARSAGGRRRVELLADNAHGGEGGVEERHLNSLAHAIALTRNQGARDAGSTEECGIGRRDRNRGIDGSGIGSAFETGAVSTARRGNDALPCRQISARIIAGEAGERAVDEARVRHHRSMGAEAKALHDTGPEVFDDHVRGGDELACEVEVSGDRQVECDSTFATVPGLVGWRVPGGTSRWVDADDVGALVREEHRAERARDVLAEIDDAKRFD